MQISSAILAGGKSTRMGKDKALLQVDGKTIIEHISTKLCILTDECVVIANDKEKYEFLNLPIYTDSYKDKGPLAGIERALTESSKDAVLFSPCDTPFISKDVYKELLHMFLKNETFDAIVPIHKGQIHPLSAIYKTSTLQIIRDCIEKDELQVKSFFNEINVMYIDRFPHIKQQELDLHFFNMNYQTEYDWVRKLNFSFDS